MISDPPRTLYLLLIVAGVVAGAVFANRQSRKTLIPFALVFLALLGVYLADFFVESPREEAIRRVQAMAAAATAIQPENFLEHVSTSFEKNGRRRDDLRAASAWDLVRTYQGQVKVWDFSRDEFKQISDRELDLSFMVKGEAANGFVLRYARARFIRDPDNAWRLKSIAFFNPADQGMKTEEPVPGFP